LVDGRITPAQLVSAGIFVAGLLLLWLLPKRKSSQETEAKAADGK